MFGMQSNFPCFKVKKKIDNLHHLRLFLQDKIKNIIDKQTNNIEKS